MRELTINLRELRAALALRGMAQYRLAVDMGLSPSVFSARVRGPVSAEFIRGIEQVLGLEAGTLSAAAAQGTAA